MSELSETTHLTMEQILKSEEFSLEQFIVLLCAASAISIMLGEKNDAYNDGGVEIKDYWDDLKDSFQMMKMKLFRVRSSSSKLADGKVPLGKPLMELTDSCVDLINYTGFHLANAIRSTSAENAIRTITNKYQAHDIFLALVDQIRVSQEKRESDG